MNMHIYSSQRGGDSGREGLDSGRVSYNCGIFWEEGIGYGSVAYSSEKGGVYSLR